MEKHKVINSQNIVSIPIALKLYQYGINQLLDEHWIDWIFKYSIEEHLLERKVPENLLLSTLTNGFLPHLGRWIFEDYFIDASPIEILEPEVQFNYLRDWQTLLICFNPENNEPLLKLILLVDDLDILYNTVDIFEIDFMKQGYYAKTSDMIEYLSESYKTELPELCQIYGNNFGERVFHDRQFCEYLSHRIAFLYDYQGLPRKEKDDIQIEYVSRENFPSWVKPTLLARERGRCSNCGLVFNELEDEPNIDHIIPLAKGGFNDLVNLQMLCDSCNSSKRASLQKTSSSIPEYLTWHRSMKTKKSF